MNKYERLLEELEQLSEYEGMNRMEQLVRCRLAVGIYLKARDGNLEVIEQ